jgi:hypothetical protein
MLYLFATLPDIRTVSQIYDRPIKFVKSVRNAVFSGCMHHTHVTYDAVYHRYIFFIIFEGEEQLLEGSVSRGVQQEPVLYYM